jgi:magnesium-transporting ATPase (P-type)
VTEGVQHIGLAFEPGEPGAMSRPPRPPEQPIFDRLMVRQVIITAVTMSGVGIALFAWLLGNGWSEAEARNLLMLLFVLFENVQVFNARSERVSAFRMPLSRNWLVVAATGGALLVHVIAMHVPFVAETLSIGPVPLAWWGILVLLSTSVLVVMEVFKRFRRGREG